MSFMDLFEWIVIIGGTMGLGIIVSVQCIKFILKRGKYHD